MRTERPVSNTSVVMFLPTRGQRLPTGGAPVPAATVNVPSGSYTVSFSDNSYPPKYIAQYYNNVAALSDATRRGVLEQLCRADASISDLAEKFHMTLTGMKKHVAVLEHAGLVATKKIGRVRTCKLGPRSLDDETAWIEAYRQRWAARFDELDQVVAELKRKEKVDGRKKRE